VLALELALVLELVLELALELVLVLVLALEHPGLVLVLAQSQQQLSLMSLWLPQEQSP
jgi:uncharacterized membrane protein YesL